MTTAREIAELARLIAAAWNFDNAVGAAAILEPEGLPAGLHAGVAEAEEGGAS